MASELVNKKVAVTVYAWITNSITLFHTSYDSNIPLTLISTISKHLHTYIKGCYLLNYNA